MRELNDFEKKVLMRMAHRESIQDLLVVSLLFEFCNVYIIGWDKEYRNLKVAFPKHLEWETVRSQIFDFIVLMKHLEQSNYIGLFSANFTQKNLLYNEDKYQVNGEFPNITIFEKGTTNLTFKTGNINIDNQQYSCFTNRPSKMVVENSKVGYLLFELVNSTYHPTQSLIDFVDKGFKTKEDKRFNYTQWTAWIAIGVSLFIGIASLLQNCHNTKVIASQQRYEVICSKNDSTLLQSQNRDEIPTTTTP